MKISQINSEQLNIYAAIPMTVEIKSIFKVGLINNGLGGIRLDEEPVQPYVKDYDTDGGSPLGWEAEFDIRNWGIFLAEENNQPVGGATVAWNTNNVNMLESRMDISVLWDIRIHPNWRRNGIGKALFQRAAQWSREHNCKQMKIETQNVNVPACRFYQSQGCELGSINRFAYPSPLEYEAMLNWYINL